MSEKLSSGQKARSKVHSFDDLFNTSTDMGFGHSVQNEKYHVEDIHETLIVPMDAGLDRQTLENMVQEVNATQVAPQDRLSDHVYHCAGCGSDCDNCKIDKREEE